VDSSLTFQAARDALSVLYEDLAPGETAAQHDERYRAAVASLMGKRVHWTGKVREVYGGDSGHPYEVWVVTGNPGLDDFCETTFSLPAQAALGLQKDQEITFEGTIISCIKEDPVVRAWGIGLGDAVMVP
jgi:hypothetical protein